MLVLVVGFLLLSLAELVVIVQVATLVGAVPTLLIMILLSAIGAWVVKHEGLSAWRRIVEGLSLGRMPTEAVVDGGLVLLSGLMLLTPGFITAAGGLLLALPPVRSVAHRMAVAAVHLRIARRVRLVGNAQAAGNAQGTGRGGGAGAGAPGPRAYRRSSPYDVTGDPSSPNEPPSPPRFGDIIDLDAEEVFIDAPIGELEPPDTDPELR